MSRVVIRGTSLVSKIAASQKRTQLGQMLEISGVCGGLWANAAIISPATSLVFLSLLGSHIAVSGKIRNFLFFGLSARNVVLLEATEDAERIELQITTDSGKRKLTLVPRDLLPEDSERVLFREMVELGVLRLPTPADSEATKLLQRLTTEDLVVIEEEVESVSEFRNFRLLDINRDRLRKKLPPWLRGKDISDAKIIEKQADQQVFVGAATIGLVAILTASKKGENSV